MKITTFSWILAGAYLFCGLGICFVILQLQVFFSGFHIELPTMTRVALGVSPVGSLCASLAVGFLVILKALRFRSRWLNSLFTLVLVSWVSCIAFAVLPLFQHVEVLH